MARCPKSLLVLLAIGACLASPATAAPIGELFRFTKTSSTPAGMVIATGQLVLSQSAFLNGVSISREWFISGGSNPPNLSGTGILSIDFHAGGIDQGSRPSPTYSDFRAYPVNFHVHWAVDLVSGPGGVPTGSVYFNDSEADFSFNLGDPASDGGANAEPGLSDICGQTGTCTFTGNWQLVGAVVPEPASAALFGTGLAGLVLLRRRKATQVVSG